MMNELLKKLFETEVLSEETKTQLQEAIATQMADMVAETKASTEDAVRLELAEQWVTTRETLIEAIDTKVTDLLEAEIKELHDDIAAFKDQEVEYAEKLVEAKQAMAEQVQADMGQLIEKLDAFLELRIAEEFAELKTDIAEAKKMDFGRRVLEAFMGEYQAKFVDENAVHAQLEEAEAKLQAVTAKLNEASATRAKLERTIKLENLLSPLAGAHRQLMETILSTVQTKELDKAYTKFIGRVLKEGVAPTQAQEDKVLAEGKDTPAESKATVVKTGDPLTESQNVNATVSALSDDEKRKLQRMAGITY
jgi:predicted RNA-binding protein Jag